MADEIRGREYLVQRQIAMTAALSELARAWKHAFRPKVIESDLQLWLDACLYAKTDLLVPAAKLMAQRARAKDYPPRAADLNVMARSLEKAQNAVIAVQAAAEQPSGVHKHWGRIDSLYYLARDHMRANGYTREKFAAPIAQMWALLLEAQPSLEHEALVRSGDVTDAVWLQVVDAWLDGCRPKGNPMNNLGLAREVA